MTPQQAVLSLGALTLSGCGAGLVLIHSSNPLLKGLNWAGSGLLAGATAAALTLACPSYPSLFPVAQVFILLACVLAYRADCHLLEIETSFGKPSLLLLVADSLLSVAVWLHLLAPRGMLAGSCFLTVVQLGVTMALVKRDAVGKLRFACLFTVGLLGALAAGVLSRGLGAASGLLAEPRWADPLNLLTYIVFIASAIGLAFTFFWRTTARLSMELEHMASTDPLTRVFNRRVFLNWCESEQARSLRLHAPFSLLMLDFDHFKQVNDTFGHHVGDQVLCAAVERIQDSIRGIDVLCRWGGEEFAVLLPNASEEATQIVAERVRRNVRLVGSSDPRFSDATYAQLQLSASVGTSTFEGEGDTYQLMLQRADAALYEAKRSGRNRVVRSHQRRSDAVYQGQTVAVEA